MPDVPTPPRRFRFGLRSLFVLVTVVCVWLGYSMNWIRQRREFILGQNSTAAVSDTNYRPVAPGMLWALGEQGVSSILVGHESNMKLARQLFPEAEIYSNYPPPLIP